MLESKKTIEIKYLKLAVLNNSGNVGKSTICDALLHPRILNSVIIKINKEWNTPSDMVEVFQAMDMEDIAILDIGSSVVTEFIKGLEKFPKSHEDIDIYIIPTTDNRKEQEDTINTINHLLYIGVEPHSIRIILNKVDKNSEVSVIFQHFFNQLAFKILNIKEHNIPLVYKTEIFNLLYENGQTYSEIFNDNIDKKNLNRSKNKFDEMNKFTIRNFLARDAKNLGLELDNAFKSLNLEMVTAANPLKDI